MDRPNGHHHITEIILKTAIDTVQIHKTLWENRPNGHHHITEIILKTAIDTVQIHKTLWEKEEIPMRDIFSFLNWFPSFHIPIALFMLHLTHYQMTKILDWSKLEQIADDILKYI